MAQERLQEWNTQDKSFNLNKMFMQSLPAGLYFGFDVVLGGTMTLTYNHNTTGKQFVNVNQTLTSKQGVIVSRQGVQIFETDTINLPIATTGVNARRDAIVCVHSYIETTGGQSASYSVKQNIGAGEPILLNNETLIAILELPANCSALNQIGVNYLERRKLNFDIIKNKLDALDVDVTNLQEDKYDKIQPIAQNVTFETGWDVAFPGQTPVMYRKDQRGRVYLQGAAIYNSAPGLTIFKLPIGFRPAVANERQIIGDNGSGVIPINIEGATGNVTVATSLANGQICWLSNISFFTTL